MSSSVRGAGGAAAKELVNSSGSKLAELKKAGAGKVSVVGGLGNTSPDKVIAGNIYSDESGVRRVGTYTPPTLASMTADATATATDIMIGKTGYVKGKKVTGTLSLNPVEVDVSLEKTPIYVNGSAAVVLNNEIHLFGGYNSERAYYKWNGKTWAEGKPSLIRDLNQGGAVVLNGEIHLLGGDAYGNTSKNHYVLRGSSWTGISNLPYKFYYSSAVVLNGEIHLLGGYESKTDHYKWDGKAWSRVSTIPYEFYSGSAVVLNNEIHLLGGQSSKKHYKFNGTDWVSVSTIPKNFQNGSAAVLNGAIYILGGNDSGAERTRYKWDGSVWTKLTDLPSESANGIAVVLNGTIYLATGNDFLALQKTLYERG